MYLRGLLLFGRRVIEGLPRGDGQQPCRTHIHQGAAPGRTWTMTSPATFAVGSLSGASTHVSWQDRKRGTLMIKRSTFALVTAVAIAGTMLIGGQAATAAASVTIPATAYEDPFAYDIGTNTPEHDPNKTITVYHYDTTPQHRLDLQIRSGINWKTVARKATSNSGQTQLAYKFPKEGHAYFRAVLIDGSRTISTTDDEKVRWKRADTEAWMTTSRDAPFEEAEGRVAANDQAKTRIYVNTSISTRTGSLQKAKGSKWVNIQKLTWKKSKSGRTITVKSPKTKANATIRYRVVVNPTTYEKGWTSKSGAIKHENPRTYTGYRKQAYDAMKKYCPNQIITVKKGGNISTAHPGSNRIEMAPRLTGATLKGVALHECAHIITFRVMGDDYYEVGQRLNKIYKSKIGIEMVADCMAFRMGADKRAPVYWYTTNCKGARDTAAKRILAGKKP